MFGREDEDVLMIHDTYLVDEPLDLTTGRLTAPFDCSLDDDLCVLIGREAAIEFTAEVVDLALDGASIEEIEAFNDEFLMRAVDEFEPDDDGISLRASGSWETDTSGNVRLRARNGVTTPVIGSRQAWTEAKTQRRNTFGWSNKAATEICVDTGTNIQTVTICGWSSPCNTTTLESFNPSESCVTNQKSHKSRTYHARNNGDGNWSSYTIRARGSASAEINGTNLSEFVSEYSKIF